MRMIDNDEDEFTSDWHSAAGDKLNAVTKVMILTL